MADERPELVLHRVTVCGIPFTVERRFTPTRLLGQGAYGAVCGARLKDGSMHEEVAIKRIAGVLATSGSLLEGKRALREIMLLRHLQHENVCCLTHLMAPPPGNDLYLVSDVMDSDMARVISSPQPLTEDHCRWFVYQMLRGLKYVHSTNVVHRDLKPSNVLLNANCDVRRSHRPRSRHPMTTLTGLVARAAQDRRLWARARDRRGRQRQRLHHDAVRCDAVVPSTRDPGEREAGRP